jgi:hypothetical protein
MSYHIQSIEPLKMVPVGGKSGMKTQITQLVDPKLRVAFNRFVTGGPHGSTQIDRAFFEWLNKILQPLDTDPSNLGTGGHFVLRPQGRMVLERFQPIKHAFTGLEDPNANLTLTQGVQVQQTEYAASKVRHRVLEITP